MPTNSHPPSDTRPRFEFYPLDSTKLQCVEIDHFPFVIGRAASASLQINSTSVSREHAEIDRTPTGFCLRDRDSTNGTSLNGRPVHEAPLVDGDLVTIADIELTFLCAALGRLQRTLTKPLPRKKPAAELPGTTPELALARGLSEVLLLQALPQEWNTIVDVETDEQLWSTARMLSPLDEVIAQGDAKSPTRVASRLELLSWHLAAEEFDARGNHGGLLLEILHRESLDERLVAALDEVAELLSSPRRVGLRINWEWATATPESQHLLEHVVDHGYALVLDEFADGAASIEAMNNLVPHCLVLSKQVVREVAQQPRRLQRLEIVQTACSAKGIEVALPVGTADDDLRACRDLGIHLLQHPATALAAKPFAAAHA